MNHSPELAELAAALSAAQAEFSAIPKTADNPFFKSKFASLPTVVATASPILTKHGLSVSQFIGTDDHGDTLTTWLLHKSGQFISEAMRLHLTKSDAQGQGSAVSYARRYSYMSVLGLVADEDDDGNRASRPKQEVKARQPGATSPPPKSEATPPKPELAHAAQRKHLSSLADELALSSTDFADAICAANNVPVREFATLDDAYVWCDKALHHLSSKLVGDVEKRLRAMTGGVAA